MFFFGIVLAGLECRQIDMTESVSRFLDLIFEGPSIMTATPEQLQELIESAKAMLDAANTLHDLDDTADAADAALDSAQAAKDTAFTDYDVGKEKLMTAQERVAAAVAAITG